MNTRILFKISLAFVSTILALVGCTEEITISNFELNKTELQLRIGETQQLIGIVTPEDAATMPVEWSSSNEAVVTVDDNGLVTAIAEGSATVTGTIMNKVATCNVTVSSPEAEGIQLNKIEMELAIGSAETLEATLTPEGADVSKIVWLSSNDDIATVSADGEVTGVSLGEAEIYAAVGELKATCKVTVIPAAVESMTLNHTTYEMYKEQTVQLEVITTPENTGNEVKWSTDKYHIAGVDANGLVTALQPGEVTISASCGGKTASCVITVLPILAESLSFDVTTLTVEQGKKAQITAIVNPANYDGEIVWTSTDETVAQVNSDGEVSGVGAGKATVKAEINGLSATCEVTVESKGLNVGDYYYSDGTYSSELDPSKTPIGIVFWVGDATEFDSTLKREHPECTNGLVIALDEKETCWWSGIEPWINSTGGAAIYDWIKGKTSDYITIKQTGDNCSPMINIQGYNNTKALEFFNENNASYPVELAQYAIDYRQQVAAPENTSDWYIPSPKETSLFITGEWDGENLMDFSIMMKVDMRDLINSKLENIEGALLLDPNRNYWTSAMSNSPTACCFDMTFAWMTIANTQNTVGTDQHSMVARCVLAF